MASKTSYRVGVDIGGTFTDIVLLGSDGTIHTKKISSSVDNYARAIVDGLGLLLQETAHRPRGARRDPPRHDGRLQRHPRAQGRQGRPDHHQGLPRRAGDPHAAHAAPLRHRLGEAAAAGGALSAPRGRRARRRQGPCRARARSGRCGGTGGRAAGREGRGDRRLPHQLVRQSGARAGDQGHRRAQGAEPARVHLLRGAARDQGVRAHLHDRDQCLRHADRGHLPRRHAQGAGRRGHPGAAAPDAVERRADHQHGGGRATHEHHRVRARPAAWSAPRRWRA